MYLTLVIITGVFIYSRLTLAITSPSDIVITNPYKESTKLSLKGNLHAHSTYGPSDKKTNNNDDGKLKSIDAGRWYKNNGYDFYALTPHFQPFKRKTKEEPSDNQMTITPKPDVDGIVWMGPSIENSFNTNNNRKDCVHTGMINLDKSLYNKKKVGRDTEMIGDTAVLSKLKDNGQSVVDAVVDGGGLVIFNHPYYQYDKINDKDNKANDGDDFRTDDQYKGCTDPDAIKKLRKLDNITGIELSGGAATDAKDEKGDLWEGVSPWDYMLVRDKKVWGFNNDDSHANIRRNSKKTLDISRGKAFNIVKSDKKDKDSIIDNIKSGNFYASSPVNLGKPGDDAGKDTPLSGGRNYSPPSGYYNLEVTDSGSNITAKTTNGHDIKAVVGYWDKHVEEQYVKEGGSRKRVTTYIFDASGQEGIKYVRFEVLNTHNKEVAWSQPIYVAARPNVAFTPIANNTMKIAAASTNLEVEVKDGITVYASSPTREKVAMKLVYKKIKDKNGKAVSDRWHNFGCHVSSSPDGKSADKASKPLYSCKVAQSNGVSDHGWTDKSKNGAMDFVKSGSSQTFPGGNSKLKLSAGTYMLATQSASESTPITGVYSKWLTGYKIVITDPIAKPYKPSLKAVVSGKNVNATIGAARCQSDTTPQYRIRSSYNDGAWSAWSAWSTTTTKTLTTNTVLGFKSSFSAQARCIGYEAVSPESDVNYTSAMVYVPLDYPRKMKIKTATYKINPLNNSKVGSELQVGTQLDFKTKVLIKSQWYLRTASDTASGIDAVVLMSSLAEI